MFSPLFPPLDARKQANQVNQLLELEYVSSTRPSSTARLQQENTRTSRRHIVTTTPALLRSRATPSCLISLCIMTRKTAGVRLSPVQGIQLGHLTRAAFLITRASGTRESLPVTGYEK